MRIAFVTQWFPPEPGTFVGAAIADGLAERGHHIDVLTGFPNYPTGRLHPDYPLQRYRCDERSTRVRVHRAPLYPSHDQNPIKRMANYTTFALSASWTARARLPRPDVWLTYSSPATAALPALTVPRRLAAPSYLIIQDLWPDSVIESGMTAGRVGRVIEKSLHAYCNYAYRRVDGIGVISPGMAEILVDRGADPSRVHFTPNWISDGHLRPEETASDDRRRALGLGEGRLFMYAGNFGELQGLPELVEAFARCPQARLALVGDGIVKSRLHAQVARLGAGNVSFHPTQDSNRIGEFIAASDVQIVSLKDSALLRATMPSKVQTSLAAGRPILAHAAGDVADTVVGGGAGVAAPPGNLTATVDAISALVRLPDAELLAMGRRARLHYLEHFSPDAGLDRLESMLFASTDVRGLAHA